MEHLPNKDDLVESIKGIMKSCKNVPFACLQISAFGTYILQAKFPQNLFQIKTGDVSYKGNIIFMQNYLLNNIEGKCVVRDDWEGHAWVEMDNSLIIDLSLFRTIYSKGFIKTFKEDILATCGMGKGAIFIPKDANNTDFAYSEKEVLSDIIVDGIVKGIEQDRQKFLHT